MQDIFWVRAPFFAFVVGVVPAHVSVESLLGNFDSGSREPCIELVPGVNPVQDNVQDPLQADLVRSSLRQAFDI